MTSILPRHFFLPKYIFKHKFIPCLFFFPPMQLLYCFVLFLQATCYGYITTIHQKQQLFFFSNDHFKYFQKGESKRSLVTETGSIYFNRKHLTETCPVQTRLHDERQFYDKN